MTLSQLKKELKERNKLENLTKSNKILLEQAWFKDQDKICSRCDRISNLTIDHIIPKDWLKQFGVDVDREFDEDNLTVLCRTCNTFKGNRLDFADKKTKSLLLKYLERV